MAELPELLILAEQMGTELRDKHIVQVDVAQEKCLNLPPSDFAAELEGRAIAGAANLGKWIDLRLTGEGHLLLNLGMGADILYYRPGEAWDPGHRVRFHFDDGSGFTCRFWWFGHTHFASGDDLPRHKLTASLGPLALSVEMDRLHFGELIRSGRGRVKSLLTDQKHISGIGNVYVQDTLFRARLHPLRPVSDLNEADVDALHRGMADTLTSAYEKRGLAYEKDFFGRPGSVTTDDFLVAYREGKPCPACGTSVAKIKTGSTASFICPACQAE